MSEDTLSVLTCLVMTKFSYLLEEYGFRFIEAREFRPFVTYYVTLVSSKCRILFMYEIGWEILFGYPGKEYDGLFKGWIVLPSLFEYLGKALPGSVSTDTRYHEEQLERLATALKEDIERILMIFESPDIVSQLQF